MRINAVSNPSLLTQTTRVSALGSLEALSAFLVEANGKKVWAIKTQLSGAQANKALRRGQDGKSVSLADKDLFTRSETIWVDEDKAINEIKFYCINGEAVSLQDFILAAPSKAAASGKRDVYQLFGRGLRISFEKTESVVEFALPEDIKLQLPEGAQACLKVSMGAMDMGVSLSLKYEGQSAEDLLNQATLRQERMSQKKAAPTPTTPPPKAQKKAATASPKKSPPPPSDDEVPF